MWVCGDEGEGEECDLGDVPGMMGWSVALELQVEYGTIHLCDKRMVEVGGSWVVGQTVRRGSRGSGSWLPMRGTYY